MKVSDWWQDKRYLHERSLVVGTAVTLVLLSLVFGLLVIMRPPDENLPTEDTAPAVAAVLAKPTPEPAKKTPVELATNLVMDGRLVEAERVLDVQELELLRLRGAIAWKRNDLPKALSCFRAAVEIEPRSVPDLCNLAGIQLQLNEAAAAVANLRVAHDVSPDDVFITNRLLLARIQAGELDRVAAEISSALQAAPETSLPSVAAAAAAVELHRGNSAKAATFLHSAKRSLAPEVFESLLVEAPLAAHSSNQALSLFFLSQARE